MKKEKMDAATPGELAAALRHSIGQDHMGQPIHPEDGGHVRELARMGRDFGLAYGAHESLGLEPWKRLSLDQLAAFVAKTISPHPEDFQAKAEAVKRFEGERLWKEAKRLDTCGTPWGRVVRLFWKDRKGREVMRTRGLHSCKHRWCPRCGKPRQTRLAGQMERVVELAREWGFDEAHLRFVTLTVPNGKNIPALREEAHSAWARLQRTRWWPGRVFGWFRGSEVITGKDGAWNMHLHIVVILWSRQISYQNVWDAWEAACGGRYQVDIEGLQDIRRKAKGNGTVRAVHYISKYIAKREELAKLKEGPGGLAHLFSGTRGMRTFAMGGGCSVLRRMLDVLMPTWALQAERVMEDAELRDGKAPFRCEEVDPTTGEVMESAIPKPYLDEREKARWRALAEPLWFESTRTVGRKAGPRGQFRRIGGLPYESKGITLDDHRKGKQQEGIRALVAGGRWRVQQWEEFSKKTGKTLKFSVVLPVGRYSWRPIAARVWAAMGLDQRGWSELRRVAFRAHAEASVHPLDKRDNMHIIAAALDDRLTFSDGEHRTTTTRRSLKAAELWNQYLTEMRTNPLAVWDDATQAIRRRALHLERPNLLEVEGPALRQLRQDLDPTF
ncbi:protein rep [Geothrix campi]|uniref:protein rep n=1 Tax=Geothrix campi TaxID=2966450 RepID=UPI0021484C30